MRQKHERKEKKVEVRSKVSERRNWETTLVMKQMTFGKLLLHFLVSVLGETSCCSWALVLQEDCPDVWVEKGHEISLEYCGTNALKRDLVRRLKEWENVLGDVGQQFLGRVNVVRAAVDKHCIYTGYPYAIVKSAPYRHTVKFFSCRGTIHTVYDYFDPGFTTECYRDVYSHSISLIPDVKKLN
ncbi:hypothetical protein C5167_015226 [Papaver somniferum]|uniref:Uncharacterized protein n=1 Tax=Papaver somniferum TaxID=3469 RepID=A0A4Y7J8H6_PAPSO|nr:hypothetical protein C5167_015226 [Papaver somniferum]